MQQADFACEACGKTEVTLNVHHPYYEKGREPWEYYNLVCLCEQCHQLVTIEQRSVLDWFCRLEPDERADVFSGAFHCQSSGEYSLKAFVAGVNERRKLRSA